MFIDVGDFIGVDGGVFVYFVEWVMCGHFTLENLHGSFVRGSCNFGTCMVVLYEGLVIFEWEVFVIFRRQ
jgi:hypothetical protein